MWLKIQYRHRLSIASIVHLQVLFRRKIEIQTTKSYLLKYRSDRSGATMSKYGTHCPASDVLTVFPRRIDLPDVCLGTFFIRRKYDGRNNDGVLSRWTVNSYLTVGKVATVSCLQIIWEILNNSAMLMNGNIRSCHR